jgi:large repetitive protein
LRRQFSTGAFSDYDDFAATFQGVATEHRFAPVGAMQGIAATPTFIARDPQGAELDEAMRAAGLEPMPVPKSPRIVVFWEQANPAATPQPVAVLVDASEPMRRSRSLPEEVTSTDPVPTKRWKMTDQFWLDLVLASGGTASVTRTIWSPGNQRALVMLDAGSRGKHLRMQLRRKAFTAAYLDGPSATDTDFVVLDEILAHAPWEEL